MESESSLCLQRFMILDAEHGRVRAEGGSQKHDVCDFVNVAFVAQVFTW